MNATNERYGSAASLDAEQASLRPWTSAEQAEHCAVLLVALAEDAANRHGKAARAATTKPAADRPPTAQRPRPGYATGTTLAELLTEW